jgi:hypothetical protein
MKTFNITKERTDSLQQLYAIFRHYQIVLNITDKEISTFIVGNVFPEIGLTAEDFPFCNIDIVNGKINFDDEKKKELLESKKEKKK